MAQVFDKYDRNRDGVLDADEVTAMIDDIGYEVDPSYVGGVMRIFGRFDIDGGGTIDMSEFPALWEHLGGPPLAAEAPPPAAALPAAAPSAAAQVFNKYDRNRDVATTSTANPVAGAQPIEGLINYD